MTSLKRVRALIRETELQLRHAGRQSVVEQLGLHPAAAPSAAATRGSDRHHSLKGWLHKQASID